MKILLTLFLFILAFQISFGQKSYEISDENNTYKHSKIYQGQNLYTEFNKYSKNDLITFSEKLEALSKSKQIGWEDFYSGDNDEVGLAALIWSKESGFVSYYVYTCQPSIRSVNFGNIKETSDTIELIPEIDKSSPRKNQSPTKYVKVKWSDRKYLVEENSLLPFAEKAAGIYVEPSIDENSIPNRWANYWVSGEIGKDLIGLPVFPSSYKKFERKPIYSRILSVGKRTVEEKELGNAWFSESAWYELKIDGGMNRGIKKGMEFYCPKLENIVYIVKSNPNSSTGLVQVDIDENKKDKCTDDKGNAKNCPKIQSGYQIETITGRMYY